MKLQEFVQTKLMPPINKMQRNPYVSSISEGMMKMMPVMLGISIVSLLYSLPIPAYTEFITRIGLYDLLSTAMQSANIMSVFFCISIAYTLGGKKGVSPFSAALVSVFSLLVVTPSVQNETGEGVASILIDTNYLGGNAIITSMLVAMVATTIFSFMVKKNFTIKFPDSVPEYVSQNFAMIPPSFVTIVVFIAFKGLFSLTPYGNMTDCIYALVQAPLSNVGNTLGGHLILILVASLLWWCGIHGTVVITPIMTTALLPSYIENMMAVMTGQPAPNLLNYVTMFVVFTCLGGTGCVLGLAIDLTFFTKSARYKTQGKVSLIPSIFNISEPLIYGTPIALNPILFVPFVSTPIIVYLIMYAGLRVGLIATPTILTAVSVLPGPIMGFLSGSVSFGIYCIVAILISCVTYFPFVKLLDKKALDEETVPAQAAGEEK